MNTFAYWCGQTTRLMNEFFSLTPYDPVKHLSIWADLLEELKALFSTHLHGAWIKSFYS